MLSVLFFYCQEWGLVVHISKTTIMVFNHAGRILKESKTFAFGLTPIDSVREYTYLRMTFNLTGSLKVKQSKLRKKGLPSYFSFKSMIYTYGT